MALKIVNKRALNQIEVISKNDDALDLDNSNWEEYEKTADMAHLKFVTDKQPTIFLCNFELKGKESASVKNSMLGGRDDDGNPSVALGSWSFRVVKYALKDIKNPDYLEANERINFKKDKDGLVHDECLAELEKYGVINEIFAMYTTLAMAGVKGNAKN
jgi:hypothetical protein